ncbi:MAG TPA: hypothetical protein PKE27_08130 [Povalibacter sp.]|uniref:hypothetical protein n=1 Tax=Povalibacter sp. TaxID=1962978 RepID=UPI002B7B5942|nr:hypothetical protein [Povalibacter sp.]HMN44524.1 hypothetical protein [Povalibacter sp.]
MKAGDILGAIGGVVFGTVGLIFAPSPAYDPEGWGYCGISAAYPVYLPEPEKVPGEHYFCLDCYECVVDPRGVFLLLLYLVAVFTISGALASRIGEAITPSRGAVSAAIVVGPALLLMIHSFERVNVPVTAVIAVVVFGGLVSSAYLGGVLAKRNA